MDGSASTPSQPAADSIQRSSASRPVADDNEIGGAGTSTAAGPNPLRRDSASRPVPSCESGQQSVFRFSFILVSNSLLSRFLAQMTLLKPQLSPSGIRPKTLI